MSNTYYEQQEQDRNDANKSRARKRRKSIPALKKLVHSNGSGLVTKLESFDPDFMLKDPIRTMTDSKNPVVVGVYGVDDWMISSHMHFLISNNVSYVVDDQSYMMSASFNMSEWVVGAGYDSYAGFGSGHIVAKRGNLLVKFIACSQTNKLEVQFTGPSADIDVEKARFDELFSRAGTMIEWVYNQRGSSVTLPLNFRPVIRSAYPWLDQEQYSNVDEYLLDFLNSESNVLIFIGPPGTGKTTLIKTLIQLSKANAKVAFDGKVLAQDDFFADFMEDQTRCMVMEDADEFLRSREDGNSMMHKFLNIADGLISSRTKKLIFSTNLPSINDIDPALMRAGRCFDVMQFRNLTRAEALNVLEESGHDHITLGDGQEFSLAEVFGSQPSGKMKRRTIGFV